MCIVTASLHCSDLPQVHSKEMAKQASIDPAISEAQHLADQVELAVRVAMLSLLVLVCSELV